MPFLNPNENRCVFELLHEYCIDAPVPMNGVKGYSIQQAQCILIGTDIRFSSNLQQFGLGFHGI